MRLVSKLLFIPGVCYRERSEFQVLLVSRRVVVWVKTCGMKAFSFLVPLVLLSHAWSAERFAGFVSEDFVFTKASFPQCHASTLCETPRGILVAWFGGTKEKAKDARQY